MKDGKLVVVPQLRLGYVDGIVLGSVFSFNELS